MNKVNAVMVGGLFDENGISAFARPVLFGTAGDAMRDALPDAVEACFFAHDDRESAVAGAQDIALDAANRFASLAALPESEHVLVLAAPFALAEEDALFHLAETHLNTGYGVSVLSAEQQGFDAEGQPLPRDSRSGCGGCCSRCAEGHCYHQQDLRHLRRHCRLYGAGRDDAACQLRPD